MKLTSLTVRNFRSYTNAQREPPHKLTLGGGLNVLVGPNWNEKVAYRINMSDEQKQITIDRIDMGTGWVCFQPGDQPPPPDQLPGFLNYGFYNWLQRNLEFKVRAVLPIVENGNTVLIHVWFD